MRDLSIRGRELVRDRQVRSVAAVAAGRAGVMRAPVGTALHLVRAVDPPPPAGDPVATETEPADETAFGVQGYACVTDTPYVMEDWLGEYEEVVRSGAFAKTLGEKADCRLLLNHSGIPLARTKSGTLQLDEDDVGLAALAPALDGDSGLAGDIRSALERGDLDEMSFMFRIVKQQWSPDFMQLDILEVELFDVSIVTFPANPATSVGLRGLDRLTELQARAAYAQLSRRLGRDTSTPTAPASTPRRSHAERVAQTLD